MKIVVTGAAGYLGSHLVAVLRAAGFEVSGLDRVAPTPAPDYPFLATDLNAREAEAEVLALFEGAECVVHCASIHPWKPYTDEEYIDANVKGTWKLYSLVQRAGINKVLLTSSIAAAGYNIPPMAWPVDETKQFTHVDIYSFTKYTQENIARQFAANQNVQTIALRPPAFMPKPHLETGFDLTGNFSVVSDIVSAHVAAVEVLCGRRQPSRPHGTFEAIFTTNFLPYTAEDASEFESEGTKALVNKYWPQAADWLHEQGYQGTWIGGVYDLSKAKALLGWEPATNFQQWFESQS